MNYPCGVNIEKRTKEEESVHQVLRFQEKQLANEIRVRTYELETGTSYPGPQKGAAKISNKPKSPFGKACLSGCLVYVVLGLFGSAIGAGLDSAFFDIPVPVFGQFGSGPLTSVALGISMIIGGLVFLYIMYPNAKVWEPIKHRLSKKENDKQVSPSTDASKDKPGGTVTN